MKRVVISMLSVLLSLVFVLDARTIRDFFATAPDDVLLILDSTRRLDMLDYYDTGRKVFAENVFGINSSQLIDVTEDYISAHISASSSISMKLLPIKNDTIIAVSYTYSIPAKDSDLKFYAKDWSELDFNTLIVEPTTSDFVSSRTVNQ